MGCPPSSKLDLCNSVPAGSFNRSNNSKIIRKVILRGKAKVGINHDEIIIITLLVCNRGRTKVHLARN